ncbi:MAG TPA: prepilin-type N-terminal cleavage/methylation domain-containing protein [Stellaceae bacterium]|nr:prepilin-type N-terminal cleavage/methylation domain-containing protein [Stellaceae bacterium]
MSRWIGLPAASRSTRRRADPDGFTLIEVLVAFAIAALLLVALLRILTLSLGAGERSERVTRATILAQSTLDAVGVVAPLAEGDVAELVNGPFRIRAAVERYRGSGAGEGTTQYLVLYRVSAAVSWREGRRLRSVSLSTLRLGPQQ